MLKKLSIQSLFLRNLLPSTGNFQVCPFTHQVVGIFPSFRCFASFLSLSGSYCKRHPLISSYYIEKRSFSGSSSLRTSSDSNSLHREPSSTSTNATCTPMFQKPSADQTISTNNDPTSIDHERFPAQPLATNSALDIAPATLFVNTGVSMVSISTLTTVAVAGVDFNALLAQAAEYIPSSLVAAGVHVDPASGLAALVVAAHALIAPLRYAITAALMPTRFGLRFYRDTVKPWFLRLRKLSNNHP